MCRFRLPILVVAVLTAIAMADTPAALASAQPGPRAADAPPVNVDATHISALEFASLEELEEHAIDSPRG